MSMKECCQGDNSLEVTYYFRFFTLTIKLNLIFQTFFNLVDAVMEPWAAWTVCPFKCIDCDNYDPCVIQPFMKQRRKRTCRCEYSAKD